MQGAGALGEEQTPPPSVRENGHREDSSAAIAADPTAGARKDGEGDVEISGAAYISEPELSRLREGEERETAG